MGDFASVASGIGSLAGALGGGGGGGGAIVQTQSPGSSELAGRLQLAGANLAAQQAKSSVADAIKAINQNYSQARYDVQPYRTAGVQALNELNQYLGMGAYNPGNAPKNPKDYQPSKSEIENYVRSNSYINLEGKDQTPYTVYTGVGARGTPGALTQASGGTASPLDIIGVGGTTNIGGKGVYTGMQTGGSISDAQVNQIKQRLIEDYVNNNQEDYERNLTEYNQNKAMYDKYSAEGPLTTQQISDRITNQPGYQAELGQGINAIEKSSSAKGYLGSGRALKELSAFGQNTLSKYYNNTLDRLSSIANQGQSAATGTANIQMNKGNQLAGLHTTLGDNIANATLAGSNALAQSTLAGGIGYKTIGGSSGGLK